MLRKPIENSIIICIEPKYSTQEVDPPKTEKRRLI